MAYPITVDFADPIENRNRLTTGFRLILAIPQIILVGGGPGSGFDNIVNRGFHPVYFTLDLLAAGVLNLALAVTSLISWFAIVFTGHQPEKFWNFAALVIGWQFRVHAYLYLLCDEYPPFGDVAEPHAYPARIGIAPQPEERNRLTVFFRLILAIPHYIALFFVGIAAVIVTVIAWFMIVFGGEYPRGMYEFSSGVLAWGTRVGGYLAFLTDEYPPFSLDREPVPPGTAGAMAVTA